ncbi:hypothetical protein IAQ61_006994 [Plenodomus lingam]|uniref:Predicted protein n=1 Tax=Leptosphaeria maculans (strain JN3 / isolate v23.1.3 / race Av1-4-5-6-7-8) TaxID=985895 RepID=E5AD54_LEPMJ|nr:predicted protein [Plenodomus lingam JN3]KAH9869781.1 hypothetical protein IAQ61_006994 [Plenodomus lingam]CBY02406.1 predicted protein [Plenodomus lingam JN3]
MQCSAGQGGNRAKQSRAEQSRAEQSKAEQKSRAGLWRREWFSSAMLQDSLQRSQAEAGRPQLRGLSETGEQCTPRHAVRPDEAAFSRGRPVQLPQHFASARYRRRLLAAGCWLLAR